MTYSIFGKNAKRFCASILSDTALQAGNRANGNLRDILIND